MFLVLKKLTKFLIVVFGCLVFTTPAHAYLDPGSASLLLQLLVGGTFGALVVVKLYWIRLKRLFGLSPKPSGPVPEHNSRNDDGSTGSGVVSGPRR